MLCFLERIGWQTDPEVLKLFGGLIIKRCKVFVSDWQVAGLPDLLPRIHSILVVVRIILTERRTNFLWISDGPVNHGWPVTLAGNCPFLALLGVCLA